LQKECLKLNLTFIIDVKQQHLYPSFPKNRYYSSKGI
jgi:hypothetical protein